MNKFFGSERDLRYESDNLINYNAGPIKIEICGFNKTIKLSTNLEWKELLPECLDIAKELWNLKESDIKIKELEIEIKYNIETISLYLEYSIIFL